MKHTSTVLLAFLIVLVVLAAPTSVQADTVSPCPPTTVARWHKVASRVNYRWPDSQTLILTPEPGMPQTLGYASWQALYDDITSLDGAITDVGLWHDSNFGSEAGNNFVSFPAGLVPEGRPYLDSPDYWMYFNYSQYLGRKLAYVRFQGDHVYGEWHAGPVMQMELGYSDANGMNMEFALYVKK